MTEGCTAAWPVYISVTVTTLTLLSSFAPIRAPQTLGLFRTYLQLASLTKTHSSCTLPENLTVFILGLRTSIFITVILPFCSVISLGRVSLTCRPVSLLTMCAECPQLTPHCWSLRVQLRPHPSTSGFSLLFTTIAFPFIYTLSSRHSP